MKKLDDRLNNFLYVIYEAFGGACSLRQALLLDGITLADIDALVEDGYLKTEEIGETKFVICRHCVYRMGGNNNQNYRLTTYNIRKSCQLADYWLDRQGVRSIRIIVRLLTQGTMHQQSLGPWEDYLSDLHAQGCYEWFTVPEEEARYMVLFPKSNDPLTISRAIKKFFDNEGKFSDISEIKPYLSVCVPNERIKNGVLKRLDAHYWWIQKRLEIFTLECPDTKDLI